MTNLPRAMIYLACPYSHPDAAVRVERFNRANRVAAELFRKGVYVFSPISHTHPIAEYGLPPGWDFWAGYDRMHLEHCWAMVVLTIPGWDQSVGVQAEIEIMRELNRPIVYVDESWSAGAIAQFLEQFGGVMDSGRKECNRG